MDDSERLMGRLRIHKQRSILAGARQRPMADPVATGRQDCNVEAVVVRDDVQGSLIEVEIGSCGYQHLLHPLRPCCPMGCIARSCEYSSVERGSAHETPGQTRAVEFP